MRNLKTHYVVFVLLRNQGAQLRIHVSHVLFVGASTHTFSNNIQKGKHSCLRIVNDILFKCWKRFPTGTTGIDYGGNTDTKRKAIRHNCYQAITEVMIWLCTEENVCMKID